MMVFSAQYTFCPLSSDICKLRIDFDTMVLSPPAGISSPVVAGNSITMGDCNTDSLTVSNPEGLSTPIICGIYYYHFIVRRTVRHL